MEHALTRLVLVQSFRGLGTGVDDELEGFYEFSGGGREVGAAGGSVGGATERSGGGGGSNGSCRELFGGGGGGSG